MRARATRRFVAFVLLIPSLVLTTVALPAGPLHAQTAARDITRFACPTELIDAAFTDIAGNTHETAITCLATYEIAQGTGNNRYSPNQFVRRGQMATFLFRLLDSQGIPMDTDDQGFIDVAGHPHEESINGIASIGIARGRTATTFAAQELITRGEMATFLVRVSELFGSPLPAGADAFDDDAGTRHEAAANAVAAAGIAQGTGNRRFDPNGGVTRAAMAAFITRLLDWGVEQALMVTFAGDQVALAALVPGEVTGGGTSGASGSIDVWSIGQDDVLCYELLADGTDPNGAVAHLHRGATGSTGTEQITLPAPLAADPDFPVAAAIARRCIEVPPATLADITANPAAWYGDIHTSAASGGAVRGQLGALDRILFAELWGDEVVPGPGDPDGFGIASFATTSQPDDLCYQLLVIGTDAPTAATLERGARHTVGSAVVTLKSPVATPLGDIYQASGCIGGVDPTVITDLKANPGAFYVQTRTAALPNGSLRGQLESLEPFAGRALR